MWVTRGYESLPWVGFAARVLTCLSSEPTGVLTPLTPRRFLLCFFENLFLSFKSKLNYACRYTPFILEAKTRFLPLVHTFVHEAYRDPWKWYLKKKTQAASYITGTGHDTVWKQKTKPRPLGCTSCHSDNIHIWRDLPQGECSFLGTLLHASLSGSTKPTTEQFQGQPGGKALSLPLRTQSQL